MIDRPPPYAVDVLRDYDEVFVPAVFHPWACLLVGALAPKPADWALDVGTGPGTVARVLAACLGPQGRVVAVDANTAMLTLAEGKPALPGAPITYLENDAASLQLPDAGFDVITCQQVLQFVEDLPTVLAEIHRVIKPGGRLGTLTWSSLDHNPLFQALFDTVRDEFGHSAADAFAKPWTLPADTLAHALVTAGFAKIVAHRRTLPAVFPGGPDDVARFLTFSAASADMATLDDLGRAGIRERVHKHLATMTTHGTVHATTTATVILARA